MIIKTNLYSTRDIAELIGVSIYKIRVLEDIRQSRFADRMPHIPKPVKENENQKYYDEQGVEDIRKLFKNLTKVENKIISLFTHTRGKWKGLKY